MKIKRVIEKLKQFDPEDEIVGDYSTKITLNMNGVKSIEIQPINPDMNINLFIFSEAIRKLEDFKDMTYTDFFYENKNLYSIFLKSKWNSDDFPFVDAINFWVANDLKNLDADYKLVEQGEVYKRANEENHETFMHVGKASDGVGHFVKINTMEVVGIFYDQVRRL